MDLRALDARLRERGSGRLSGIDPETHAMTLRFVQHPDAMQTLGFGFREPSLQDPEVAPGEVDAVVVPALAADPRGHRIGYGAGYYDRTLPRFAPPAASVAVVFDFQLVAEVPSLESDVTVGWIVTDTRVLRAVG